MLWCVVREVCVVASVEPAFGLRKLMRLNARFDDWSLSTMPVTSLFAFHGPRLLGGHDLASGAVVRVHVVRLDQVVTTQDWPLVLDDQRRWPLRNARFLPPMAAKAELLAHAEDVHRGFLCELVGRGGDGPQILFACERVRVRWTRMRRRSPSPAA